MRRKLRRLLVLVLFVTAMKGLHASGTVIMAMANAMPHFSAGVYMGQDVGLETGFCMFGDNAVDAGIDVRIDFKGTVSSVLMGIGRLGRLSVGLGAGTRVTDGDADMDFMLKGALRIWIFEFAVRGDLFLDNWKSEPEPLLTASLRINVL